MGGNAMKRTPQEIFQRTEWLRKAEYGFFFHFLNPHRTAFECNNQECPLSQKEWDEEVAAFNVDLLAEQLHKLHAGYAFLTVGQNSGYYCSPNAAYDRFLGLKNGESRCSKRDLIGDFADALAKYDIPLMVYTTALAPYFDRLAVEKLEAVPPYEHLSCSNAYRRYQDLITPDARLGNFHRKWQEIHSEWSIRWGSRVKGWWVDGAIFTEHVYNQPDEPNGCSFVNSLRAGNPDSLVAMNQGMFSDACPINSQWNDFTAGEVNTPEYGIRKGPLIDGAQYHLLSFIGSSWGKRPWRYTGRQLAQITRTVTNNGGVISWDLPFSHEKGIEDDAMALLEEFVKEYQTSKAVFPKISVDYTAPRILADGTGIPGKVVIEGNRDPALKVSWNGKEFAALPSREVKYALPAVDPTADLVLEKDGFRCVYPIAAIPEFHWENAWSPEFELRKDGELLAKLQFAVKNLTLLIRGRVYEEKIIPPRDPQYLCPSSECSCLVVFTSGKPPMQTHFFFRPDGHIFSVYDCSLVRTHQDIIYRCGKMENGSYPLEVELPLKLIRNFDGKRFLLNIAVNASRKDRIVTAILFGGGNKQYVPSYEMAEVYLEN